MSNKTVRANTNPKKNHWKLKCCICVFIAIICAAAAAATWYSILTTSQRIQKKIDALTPGTDYFYEDVTITYKDTYSDNSAGDTSSSPVEYYLYYNQIKEQKLYVDQSTYDAYDVGDQIKAYTPDHHYYYFTKEAMAGKIFTDNESDKALGCLLTIAALGAAAGAAMILCFDGPRKFLKFSKRSTH